MIHHPFYDPEKTYDENYEQGPFHEFTDEKSVITLGEPQNSFLGIPVYLPFGIPAGPLLNSKFIKSAFEKGFDISVYKTVRSMYHPSHAFPNILTVEVNQDLTQTNSSDTLVGRSNYSKPLSITNSFGVPSKEPHIWQEDVKKSLSYAGKGQLLLLSFTGTAENMNTQTELIDDYALTAKLAAETGVKVLEVNLSCPNIGTEGLICYDLETTEKICKKIRSAIGNLPLILKVGHYQSSEDVIRLAEIANEYANAISAVNTLQAKIIDEKGKQALPGKNRLKSGIAGQAIKWAGIDMAKRLKEIRSRNNFKFEIIGVGGVMNIDDYLEYKDAGATCVMSATGSMWNPYLARDIKKSLGFKVNIK